MYVGEPPLTAVFSGPSQIQDAQISADTPTTANGSGTSINVDGQTPHAHGLMKFPTLIGAGAGQVPAGCHRHSAVLQLNCTNSGNPMRLYPPDPGLGRRPGDMDPARDRPCVGFRRRRRRRVERRG